MYHSVTFLQFVKARYLRRTLGGGMPQIGVIAAAGLFAVSTMADRLEEDHNNAKKLAGNYFV